MQTGRGPDCFTIRPFGIDLLTMGTSIKGNIFVGELPDSSDS